MKTENDAQFTIHLSKTKYCNAVQCPKMLWLKQMKPECFDSSVMNQSVLDAGNEVGDLAMGLFGPYTEVAFNDLSQMISDTQALLLAGTPIIAEASFSYNGLFCSVDILKVIDQTNVEIYEIKSSTEISDIYYHDAAYQNYVLTRLGYNVQKVCLVNIDNTYVRHGDLELNKLFKINDITFKAKEMFSEVDARVLFLAQYLENATEPNDGIDMHCFQPYPCGFFAYCARNLPTPNVFHVSGMQTRTKVKLYHDGKVSFSDLLASNSLNPGCRMQVEHETFDLPNHIEKDGIQEFLGELYYPLYFLDFESFQSAIPRYDDSKPYEQIVFQYSLHYFEHEGAGLKHKEYLAYPGEDPRRKLAEQLCRDIPDNACVLAYNMSFEKGRIAELADLYPDLREHLLGIKEHIQDLMIPFRKKLYYTKEMQGSYSIKYVLPALTPNDPSLDYHNLEGVHNGTEASATFIKMHSMDKDELEKWRKNLLRYCGLDTYAMVKVWEKLREVTNS